MWFFGGGKAEAIARAWTQGSKSDAAGSLGPRYFEHLFLRTSGRFAQIEPSRDTAWSERKLGMQASTYFYVARCVPEFGDGIALFRAPRDRLAGHVVPFDTGGLAQGHVRIKQVGARKMTPADVYRDSRIELKNAVATFVEWIESSFRGVADYVRGTQPSRPRVADIVIGSKTDARAWTWEVSVPRAETRARELVPERIVVRTGTSEEFKDWVIENAPVADRDKELYLRRLGRTMMESSDPVGVTLARLEKMR
jgi:hypothetical protein